MYIFFEELYRKNELQIVKYTFMRILIWTWLEFIVDSHYGFALSLKLCYIDAIFVAMKAYKCQTEIMNNIDVSNRK